MANSSGGVVGLKIIKFFVWLVYALATAAIIVLSFGFVLLLFSANPTNDFAAFIMRWGTWFAQPFVGLVEPTPTGNGGVIAWSLLFAIAVYAVLAWLIGMALDSISRRVYRSTHGQVVGQRTVTTVHQDAGGDVVQTSTTSAVVAPPRSDVTAPAPVPQPAPQPAPQQPAAAPAPVSSEPPVEPASPEPAPAVPVEPEPQVGAVDGPQPQPEAPPAE